MLSLYHLQDPFKLQLFVSRFILVLLSALIFAGCIKDRKKVIGHFNNFLFAPSAPTNLCLFRIMFFWIFLTFLRKEEILTAAKISNSLIVPPWGFNWIISMFPVSEFNARFALNLLELSAVFSLIGLFTRLSITVCALVGVYALGLPHLFGKVHHSNHHFIWFMWILAMSPCGATLSLDSLYSAWKKAKDFLPQAPSPSPAFTVPLRLIWLLMGIIYFFPGFFKLWQSGIEWAFSDNLRNIMYYKWFEMGASPPKFRIDHYPVLLRFLALGTILFEICFIILVQYNWTRRIAICVGIIFHTATDYFLLIPFSELKTTYVVLIDWESILKFCGTKLYPPGWILLYNKESVKARRIVSSLLSLDIFGKIHPEATDKLDLIGIKQKVGRQELTVSETFFRLLIRNPLCIFALIPFFFSENKVSGQAKISTKYGTAPALIMGISLILINSFCGVNVLYNAWPFSIFPTFHQIHRKSSTTDIEIRAFNSQGNRLSLEAAEIKINSVMDPVRKRKQLMNFFYGKQAGIAEKNLRVLFNQYRKIDPRLNEASVIQVISRSISLIPEERGLVSSDEDILAELKNP